MSTPKLAKVKRAQLNVLLKCDMCRQELEISDSAEECPSAFEFSSILYVHPCRVCVDETKRRAHKLLDEWWAVATTVIQQNVMPDANSRSGDSES